MSYIRPKSDINLTPNEKRELLHGYFEHYREIARVNPDLLNAKIPRHVFDRLLNEIGALVLEFANSAAEKEGEVKEFISMNPLPPKMDELLPENFRAYCLALNALKQWVSAEQAATDRYIFGGTVRNQCRELSKTCIASGAESSTCTIELHHPVRDGRPPIPLSKEAHAEIENQSSSKTETDDVMAAIYPIKRAGNRSWVMLKLGCRLLQGDIDNSKSINVQSSSKTFARKASEATNMGYADILTWISENNLT